MKCAWKELLNILPPWMRPEVDALGKDKLQELRLRLYAPPELVLVRNSRWLERNVCMEDLTFCIHAASQYSPWAASTASMGYLSAPGGHRIGMCGEAVIQNGSMTGIRNPSSLCIRIARDFSGISDGIPLNRSLLILGAPGWGKTTLLRVLIRRRGEEGCQTAVVDERGELFPLGFPRGKRVDILTGCPKAQGIPALLRTMGPGCIAVDEITEIADCSAIMQAQGCGVQLLATAHASSLKDFFQRPVYRALAENKVFHTAVILRSDKSWYLERMA